MQINWKTIDKIWTIASWIGFFYLLVYFTLKALGVLHSPPIADILGIFSAGVLVGKFVQRVDHIHKDVEFLTKRTDNLEKDMSFVKTHLKQQYSTNL